MASSPGLRDVVDALDAVHVAGGDRVERGQVARMARRGEALADRRSTASGQPSPLDELTVTTCAVGNQRRRLVAAKELARWSCDLLMGMAPQESRTTRRGANSTLWGGRGGSR